MWNAPAANNENGYCWDTSTCGCGFSCGLCASCNTETNHHNQQEICRNVLARAKLLWAQEHKNWTCPWKDVHPGRGKCYQASGTIELQTLKHGLNKDRNRKQDREQIHICWSRARRSTNEITPRLDMSAAWTTEEKWAGKRTASTEWKGPYSSSAPSSKPTWWSPP